jgi:serine/threonine protein kinase/Flp pilus assembly protein TadD
MGPSDQAVTWSSDPRVKELASRFEELCELGQAVSLETACAEFPELLEAVHWELECRKRADSYLSFPDNEETKPPVVKGYEILGELGRGGMGVVYKARQLGLNRIVALKMIRNAALAGADERDRFRREAEAVAQLTHPHVVQIHEIGETDGIPYFSLEYCGGGSLAARLNGTPLPAQPAAQLVETLAGAVQVAHQAGIVHRDLKPGNVLLQKDEGGSMKDEAEKDPLDSSFILHPSSFVAKIADFGLAKTLGASASQSVSGAMVGTPSYMAPEQARASKPGHQAGEGIGPAADVYALGAILYELLTGRAPFKAASAMETVLQVLEDEPVPPRRLQPKLPADLETICLKCLEKESGKRYPSAQALADDLRRYRAGEPIVARPVSRLERTAKWVRRNKATAAFVAAALLLVVGASAAGLWYQADRVSRATELALRREYLNKEVALALDEAATKRSALHARLKDPRQDHELLSDIDQWRTRLQEARAAWERALALAKGAPELLNENLAKQLGDLERGFTSDEHDWNVAKELDDVRLEGATLTEGSFQESRLALKKYPTVFAKAGLAVEQAEPAEVAARVAQSPARAALVAALDHWANLTLDQELRPRLLEVARKADPDPWRDRFRDSQVWNDRTALEALVRELRPEDQSPQLIINLARELNRSGGNSVGVLHTALLHHSRDFWLYTHLGQYAKDPVERMGYLQAALALRPQSGPIHNNLGKALYDKKDFEGAISHYRKAIVLMPDNSFAQSGFHSNLGAALRDNKDLKGAVIECVKAVQLNPNNAAAHNNLGTILFAQNDLEAAIREYKTAIQIDSGNPAFHINIGDALRRKMDVEGALTHYRKAILLEPNSALAHLELGNALSEKRDVDGAIAAHRQAIRFEPNNSRAHNCLGLCLDRKKDLEGAIAAYRQAIRVDPNNFGAHNNLGKALHDKKDLEGAITHYREAILLQPKYALAHFNLGIALYQKKDVEGAIAAYREVIQIDGNHVGALGNLAVLLLEKGAFAEARQTLGQCLKRLPAGHPRRSAAQELLERCDLLLRQDRTLAAFLEDGKAPTDIQERLALAEMSQRYKQYHAAAAQLYAGVFQARPTLADSLAQGHRYRAACSAVLAAAGKGLDPKKPNASEKTKRRAQALDWLRADLDLFAKQVRTGQPDSMVFLLDRLPGWEKESALASVREPEAFMLPAEDQGAWRKLWSDVDKLVKQVLAGITMTSLSGNLTANDSRQARALKLETGKTYVFDMHSADFDAYLKLEDDKGKVLAENDDVFPGNLDARIVFTPVEDGTFRIVATSLGERGTGAYTLTIRAIGAKNK